MTDPSVTEIVAGIHKLAFPVAVIYSGWLSRRELTKGNIAESIWWAWTCTVCVLLG